MGCSQPVIGWKEGGGRGEVLDKRRVLEGLFNTQTACSLEWALHFVSCWRRKGLSFTLHHRQNKNTYLKDTSSTDLVCMLFLLDWTFIQLNQAKKYLQYRLYIWSDVCQETYIHTNKQLYSLHIYMNAIASSYASLISHITAFRNVPEYNQLCNVYTCCVLSSATRDAIADIDVYCTFLLNRS